jgi:hypothetical protein
MLRLNKREKCDGKQTTRAKLTSSNAETGGGAEWTQQKQCGVWCDAAVPITSG